ISAQKLERHGMTPCRSVACSMKPRRTAACGAPTGRTCIALSVRTRLATRTTASSTKWSGSHCSSATYRIARRVTAFWSITQRASSISNKFQFDVADIGRIWCGVDAEAEIAAHVQHCLVLVQHLTLD